MSTAAVTLGDVELIDRRITVVDATGPRGGAQYFNVFTNRENGEPTHALHSPSGRFLDAAVMPPNVREAARRAWRQRYA